MSEDSGESGLGLGGKTTSPDILRAIHSLADALHHSLEPSSVVEHALRWMLSFSRAATVAFYLLGAAVAPERRREIEHDMLGRYVDGLGRRGIDYAMDECLADYALGSLHGVLVAVTATTVAAQTERGDALFTLMLNRHGRHGLDLDALSRLRAS